MERIETTLHRASGNDLFVRATEHATSDVAYAVVLVHGTAGHGGCYEAFTRKLAARGCNVYSFDLTGHGRSSAGRPRGVFTFEGFLEDVDTVAQWVKARTGLPVVLLGASQGGEIAFHALAASPVVAGAVCMNVLLSAELPMNAKIRMIQSPLGGRLAARVGDRLRIPLRKIIDFAAAYEEDPGALAKKALDPEYVWSYGFASYRSVFAYRPPISAAANVKPVLVACGEDDPIVGADHCRACFDRMGGPKDFFSVPGAGHQLMMFQGDLFARAVDSWVRHRVLASSLAPWAPPVTAEEQGFFRFLGDLASPGGGEPEYRYSLFDRALARVYNGSLRTGVRYFASGRETEQWRFTAEVVSEIDYAAWQFFAGRLPEVPESRSTPRSLALVGCGTGLAVEGLLSRFPVLAEWRITAIDVDAGAVSDAQRRLARFANVECRAGDARDEKVLEPGAHDVVYMHGIFDHASDHRGLAMASYRALRPGGKFFYVTPDRNLYCWLSFVVLGPRWVFGLRQSNHDFLRFPKPRELDRLLESAGFRVDEDPDRPGRTLHRGVEYTTRLNALAIRRSVRARTTQGIAFELMPPRWWLNGGFLGEYLGTATRGE